MDESEQKSALREELAALGHRTAMVFTKFGKELAKIKTRREQSDYPKRPKKGRNNRFR